ncbi:MAG: hypothetical protein WCR02_12040 [Sphaerochaetaceae bacterium]|jgi:tetratricopeptide (TPR) repeat protein
MDYFKRLLIYDDLDDVLGFAKAQNVALALQKKEVDMFNQYGPRSWQCTQALKDLIPAFQYTRDYSMAIESAKILNQFLENDKPSEVRVENLYQIAASYIQLGNVIEAQEIVVPLLSSTSTTAIGQWSRYWNLQLTSLLADLAHLKEQKETELEIRRVVLNSFSNEFGVFLYDTFGFRLLLGESLERNHRWKKALEEYRTVYSYFHEYQMFTSIEERISLLSHIYKCQKHIQEEAATQSKAYILLLLRQNYADDSIQKRKVLKFLKNC